MREQDNKLPEIQPAYKPTYYLLSRKQRTVTPDMLKKPKREPSSTARLTASYVSTIIGVTVTSPIEVLKTRMQVQHDKQYKVQMYNKIFNSFHKIWKQEGVAGMFKGYRAALICTPVFNSIYFPLYEKLRLTFAEKFQQDKSSFKVVASSCGIAGLISSFITNPMWVIRTRMMAEIFKAQGVPDYEIKYKNLFSSIMRVRRKEGLLTLYTGLTASFFNLSHVLVYFTIYEKLKVGFKKTFQPKRETLGSFFVSMSVILSKL